MTPPSFRTYDELCAHVADRGHESAVLGHAPDGAPILDVRAGGDAQPAVVITAGAHATEHAGVAAAVELADALETDHEVHIVPSRDPVGLSGYEYALGRAIGEPVSITDYDHLFELLGAHGEVVHDEAGLRLALVGDTGFAWARPGEDPAALRVLSALKDHAAQATGVLDPFRGRRILAPAGFEGIVKTGAFDRAYTFVVSPSGEFLHLNRFFDRDWAPVETRCVRRLMDDVQPGLTMDLHESARQAERFHISIRPQRTEAGDEREAAVARAIVEAVEDTGLALSVREDIFGGDMDVFGHDEDDAGEDNHARFYSELIQGAYWCDPNATDPPRRGEGLNANDYAAEHYGLSVATETGMYDTYENRVLGQITSVQTAVGVLESAD